MSSKLRDLIRAVRSCKTAAEERAVLQRESALVRQQLAAGNNRGTCMLKMMYMTMLGYATEFGQMEVIKLLAEPDFASKRIGYLTLCVLMDEHQEVLTLAENHMKRDLVSTSNPFVQGLALDTIANIAGEDMSRDMMNEVLTLCNSTNTTLKKKAALAAQRAVRKAPELVDVFLEDERLMSIFSERNHGVLVCNLALLNECLASPNGRPFLKRYAALIPGAVRHLSALVLSAFANEYEVGGVADPFLQVKLLTFLRIVGSDSEEAAESMNNVLAQTATNTSMDKNVGSSVLYECVKTILAIQCDESLRMLAYNILGRFMDRDNNCRFVALSTFLDVVQVDKTVAQRHRTTVLDCLKDVDTSIRRRALQLTVALVDETNVRLMAADLLAYLAVCTEELKEETSEQLCRVIEQRSPNDEWRVEMSIKLFRNLHAKVPMSFAVNFIGLITRADADLQQRCAKTLWDELNTAAQDQASLKSRTSFLAAAIWVAGEFSQHLASNAAASDNLVGTLGTLVADVSAPEVKQYAVNAVMKIAARFPSASPLARSIFEGCATSMNVELQQRAAEYIELLQLEAELIAFAFSPGGAISVETQSEAEALRFSLPTGDASSTLQSASAKTPAPPKEKSGIDLDSLFDSVPKADPPRGSGAPPPTQTNPPPVTNLDEFLFGPSPRAPAPAPRTGGAPSIIGLSPFDPPPTTVVVQQSAPLGAAPVVAPAPVPAPRSPKVIVHEAADLLVSVSAKARPSPNELDVSLFVTSRSLSLTGVLLSIAVTKTQTVELGPTMTDSVQPNGVLEQSMVIHGPGPHTRLAMMVKVSYKVGAQARSTEFKFAKELPLTGN